MQCSAWCSLCLCLNELLHESNSVRYNTNYQSCTNDLAQERVQHNIFTVFNEKHTQNPKCSEFCALREISLYTTNRPCLSFSLRIFSMSPALFFTRPKKSSDCWELKEVEEWVRTWFWCCCCFRRGCLGLRFFVRFIFGKGEEKLYRHVWEKTGVRKETVRLAVRQSCWVLRLRDRLPLFERIDCGNNVIGATNLLGKRCCCGCACCWLREWNCVRWCIPDIFLPASTAAGCAPGAVEMSPCAWKEKVPVSDSIVQTVEEVRSFYDIHL